MYNKRIKYECLYENMKDNLFLKFKEFSQNKRLIASINEINSHIDSTNKDFITKLKEQEVILSQNHIEILQDNFEYINFSNSTYHLLKNDNDLKEMIEFAGFIGFISFTMKDEEIINLLNSREYDNGMSLLIESKSFENTFEIYELQ